MAAYPEVTIAYDADEVHLAGDLTPEQVQQCLGAGVKSWLYLNDITHAACPKAAVEAASVSFECVPLLTPASVTAAAVDTYVAFISAAPRPLLIQCSTATRAGIPYLIHKAVTSKLPSASAIAAAAHMTPPLKFVERADYTAAVAAALAPRKPTVFRQLFDTAGSSTYTYLIADGAGGEAVLIDPVLEMVDRDLALIQQLGVTLKYCVNTHCHADHVTGSGMIKARLPGVQSVISVHSGAVSDVKVDHGDRIEFGDMVLEVRATPGHTAGCVSYVCGGWVFTGDALLIRGCGRTDFQGGSSADLHASVHKQIFSLPDSTVVYPAHDYKGHCSSTVGEEKAHNPRLSKTVEEFTQLMAGLNLPYPKKIDDALPKNLLCGVPF